MRKKKSHKIFLGDMFGKYIWVTIANNQAPVAVPTYLKLGHILGQYIQGN